VTISGAPVPAIKHLLKAPHLSSIRLEDLWYNVRPGYVVRPYLLGRFAMAEGIQAIDKVLNRSNPTVWLPDYFCRETTEHLRATGIRLRFYPISEDLSPAWVSLEDLLEPDHNLNIFVLVHYFGFCNDMRTAEGFCNKHGMILLEDAAHMLAPHKEIGFGDLTIYSPRKLFAIPSGAVLVIKDEYESHIEGGFPHYNSENILRWTMLSLFKAALLKLHIPWHSLRGSGTIRIRIDSPDQCEGPQLHSYNPYAFRLLSLVRSELATIVERRRTNYFSILSGLEAASGVRPFFSTIDEQTCPYAFPVYVEENIERILVGLNKLGIPASRWPSLPSEILSEQPKHRAAMNIYDHMMLLPLHQGVSEDQARTIGKALYDAARDI
jgi:hypothetical protein